MCSSSFGQLRIISTPGTPLPFLSNVCTTSKGGFATLGHESRRASRMNGLPCVAVGDAVGNGVVVGGVVLVARGVSEAAGVFVAAAMVAVGEDCVALGTGVCDGLSIVAGTGVADASKVKVGKTVRGTAVGIPAGGPAAASASRLMAWISSSGRPLAFARWARAARLLTGSGSLRRAKRD